MLKLLFVLLVAALVLIVVRIVSGTPISAFARRVLGPPLCAVVGHRRDGGTVRRSDEGYHARCRWCDARLFKRNRQDEWSASATARDEERGGKGKSGDDGSDNGYAVVAGEERGA